MFAAIHIPDFSLQAILRADPNLRTLPVALVDPEISGTPVVQCTTPAREAGVSAGLTPAQAAARCRDLIIRAPSRPQESSATEILLQTAYAFSPNIESTALGVCTIELKRLGLHNESALQQYGAKIVEALEPFCLESQIGIAPTPELALLAARGNRKVRVVQSAKDFAAHLPVTALEPAPGISAILPRWGIRSAGQLLDLGKSAVSARLGAGALELFERVSGNSARPLKLISPPEVFSEHIEFEHEVETADPLIFVLRRFVEQLSQRLKAIYLVAGELQMRLGLASGDNYEHCFTVPSPTGSVETLFRMLQTHLETVRADSPILSLDLTARPARPETHQFGLFDHTLRNPNQFAETLAQLTALAGSKNVGTPVLEATHRPDAFRMQRPDFDAVQHSPEKTQNTGLQLRRFRPPLAAHFEFRGANPALVRSESFRGAVSEARGPYMSSGHWWDDSRWAREEWDVELAGRILIRIFRSNEGCFIEGMYD